MDNSKNIKVCIILDSIKCPWYIYDIINWLQSQKNIQFNGIIIQSTKTEKNLFLKFIKAISEKKVIKLFNGLIIKLIYFLEKKIILIKNKTYIKYFLAYDLSNYKIKKIYIKNLKSNNNENYYNEKDILKIKKLKLDIIIRGGSGILKGEILKSCKYGIISFHHGDNKIYRGGPPGFWEVFYENSCTGFIIQQLTEQLDGGNVIFSGHFKTKTSYVFNQITLFERSNFFFKKILLYIQKKKKLPYFKINYPYYNRIFSNPNIFQLFKYIKKTITRKIFNFIKVRLINEVWNIGYHHKNFNNLTLYNSKKIKNPKGSFLADPFIMNYKKRNYIFAEEYNFNLKKGLIAVYKINEIGYKKIGIAIKEDFHLSFPYIFKFNKKFYLIPESSENKDIRLYECLNFPLKWKLKKILFKNINAVDSIILYHKKIWWLLTNISKTNHIPDSEFNIFYSKNGPITNKWISHPENPILLNPLNSRNAGLIKVDDSIYRISQSPDFYTYGKSLNINKIIKLNTVQYKEKIVSNIKANFLKEANAIHHLDSKNNFTVFDYCTKNMKINFFNLFNNR
jgi:hypothetical protein